jgi:MFS family permease
MVPVSFVLFARQATGSFASASLVLAALTAGRLLLSPRRGRMLDRLGPSRALLWLLPGATATDIAFILAGRAHPDPVVLIAVAAISGAATAPTGTVMRSVWAALLPDSGLRRTGFALMSVIGEVTFFTGPLLAGILIAGGSPTLAVAVGAGLNAGGSLVLALSSAARCVTPHPPAGQTVRLPALAGAGVRYVAGISALFGLTFGLLDVAWPAFARAHGSIAAAGLVLSLFAVGAGVGGLLYGALKHHRSAISLSATVPACGGRSGTDPCRRVGADHVDPRCAQRALLRADHHGAGRRGRRGLTGGSPRGGVHMGRHRVWRGVGAWCRARGQLIVQSGDRAALIAAAGATAAAWALATRLQSARGPGGTASYPGA